MRRSRAIIYLATLFIIFSAFTIVNISDYYSPTAYASYSGDAPSAAFAGEGKVVSYEKRIRGLQPGQLYEIKVIKESRQRAIPFESAEFMVKDFKREAIISFKKPTQLPSSAQADLPGNLINFGQIVISSPQEVSDKISASDLENTAITFSVEKNFIKYQEIDESTIRLNLLSGGSWQEIPVTRLPEGPLLYYYRAQVPFGIYAITHERASQVEEEIEEVPEGTVCGNDVPEAGENCATCAADVKCGAGEVCQSGVCAKPVVQQPVQQVAPPPRVRTPQKGFNWLWVLIPGIIIMLVLIVMLIFRRGGSETGFEIEQPITAATVAASQAPAQPQQPVQQPQNNSNDPRVSQIKTYIEGVLSKGFTKEQVRSALITKKWPAEVIDSAFRELGK